MNKVDLLNLMFSLIRISGLTIAPDGDEYDLALDRLEDMMAEFEAAEICIGYNFEENPELLSRHNIHRKFRHNIASNLALRLVVDFFGPSTQINPLLVAQADQGYDALSALTARPQQILYPDGMPLGRGNRRANFNYISRSYKKPELSGSSCSTLHLMVGEQRVLEEDFSSLLGNRDFVVSVKIRHETGITVSETSLVDAVFKFKVRLDRLNGQTQWDQNIRRLDLVATTNSGEIVVRNFEFVGTPSLIEGTPNEIVTDRTTDRFVATMELGGPNPQDRSRQVLVTIAFNQPVLSLSISDIDVGPFEIIGYFHYATRNIYYLTLDSGDAQGPLSHTVTLNPLFFIGSVLITTT